LSVLSESKAYVKYWQKQLRLLDWKIKVVVRYDPEEFNGFACMKHNLNFQMNTLEVLDPSLIKEEWAGCRDLEVTIVHELLHTRFIHAIKRKKESDPHEEMAIEVVAQALVAARRGIDIKELI